MFHTFISNYKIFQTCEFRFCLKLLLTGSGSAPPGGAVQLFCRPGQRLSLPCPYGFEDGQNLERLTVRWTSPRRKLLCHYIKHRKYQNCSAGYAMRYRPGSIQLSIQRAQNRDLGTHVCSVAKPHESQDFSIHVAWMEGSRHPPC